MSGRAFEQTLWCEHCEAFVVPTDAGECGECATLVVWQEGGE